MNIFLCVACLHVSSEFYMWDGMFTSCGLALLFVRALLHLLLDCLHLRVLSLQLTQKISTVSDCLTGLPNSPGCGSLTRTSMCYSSHVVMSCKKQPWQMLPFPLRNDTLPTAIIILIHSHNLFVCAVQREEIVSSANSMKYKIANLLPHDTRLTKHQRSHEYN